MLHLILLAAGCPSGVKESAAPADTGDSAADSAPPDSADSAPPPDTDGDGYADEDDCAPADPAVNPAAAEACNGVDDDCDGEVDDGLLVSTYADADGDTHGDPAAPVQACPGAGGTSDLADDCDDTEPLAYPGNTESCGDGIDNDCSGGTEDCRWSGTHDLDDVGHWIDAEMDTDRAGDSIAALGDVDGDGIDDFAVGAPGHGVVEDDYSDRGAVYVVRGSASGLVDNLGDAWAIVDGVDPGGQIGNYVVGLGDIDGDGLGDIGVMAQYEEMPAGSDLTGLYLFRGLAGGTQDVDAAADSLLGTPSVDRLAGLASSAGDLTGDGALDLLVTGLSSERDGYDILACPADLPGGSSVDDCSTLLYSAMGEERNGSGVDGTTDLDGDGLADLAVSDSSDCSVTGNCVSLSYATGVVRVYSGPVTGTLGWEDWSAELLGEAEGDVAAMNWPSVGDTNGDGYADLAVGAQGWDDSTAAVRGAVYVVLGPLLGSSSLGDASARLTGSGEYDSLGAWVRGPGDVDGDGVSDLAVAALLDDFDRYPSLHLLHGPFASGALPDAGPSFTSGKQESPIVGGLGDIDGDGLADAAMGLAGYEWSAAWPDVPAGGLHVLLGQGI